jgi:hypothetical protein
MIDAELLSLIEDLHRLPHNTAWAKVKEAWQGYHCHLRNSIQVFGLRPSECYNPP